MTLKVIQPWYADGLQFECTGCGNCCTGGPGYVWISDDEIDLLAKHLRLTLEQTLKQHCRKLSGQISLKEKPRNARGEYDCVFLKEVPAEPGADGQVTQPKRICEIYPVRPLQCRTWPFWDGNLASPETWAIAGKRCPGIGTGKRWTRKAMESMRDATEWPEQK